MIRPLNAPCSSIPGRMLRVCQHSQPNSNPISVLGTSRSNCDTAWNRPNSTAETMMVTRWLATARRALNR